LVKGGEKTGTLSQALFRLSSFYEAEIDRDLKRLTDLIEPVLTVVLGIIVAAIALAVIAPIYQLTSKIK
jgi:type II secretory pathway component PulF